MSEFPALNPVMLEFYVCKVQPVPNPTRTILSADCGNTKRHRGLTQTLADRTPYSLKR